MPQSSPERHKAFQYCAILIECRGIQGAYVEVGGVQRRAGAVIFRLLILSAAGLLAGCAEWSESSSSSLTLVPSASISLGLRDGDDRSPVIAGEQMDRAIAVGSDVDAERSSDIPAAPAPLITAEKEGTGPEPPPKKGTQEQRSVDNLYDPFETPGEQPEQVEEYDPWEPFNVAIFNFNRKVDKYVLKPVATVYDKVLPDDVELSIRRFFHNVRFMPRLLNNVFQGKFKGAGIEMGRFLVNSTLGLAGFLDFAKEVFGWETPDEDLGQTLGKYGVKPGRYLVLPIPPFVTTVRDLVGYIGDFFLDPINYLVFPSIELDGAPSLVGHTHRLTTTFAQLGARTADVINERSINLENFQSLEESTVDLYATIRNAYLQKRAQSIRE
jgi:phospholipid-binding lipoprotein MlaA